jgi:hypothetical protein
MPLMRSRALVNQLPARRSGSISLYFRTKRCPPKAMTVVARVEAEIERLQRSGELKSVNKSYRAYRIEASARGEKTLRYDEWMGKYRENLVRQLAAALRYV